MFWQFLVFLYAARTLLTQLSMFKLSAMFCILGQQRHLSQCNETIPEELNKECSASALNSARGVVLFVSHSFYSS